MASPAITQTPQGRSVPLPSPTQASPQRSTPGSGGKQAVLKALPTVRDHTTDQPTADGDEYVAREHDDAGETKVNIHGYLQDGREYRIRTFVLPNRGEKLFMLATECARMLNYRDSYLLFNKNRSLYKIIANQSEKENLIHQEILPYSYRSRQIAIVTARSMFRQFGSKVITEGRRVRDDYWESKARKQGFTEEDAAGEKRPGAARQREAAAAEASTANVLAVLPKNEIIYSNGPGLEGQPPVPPGIHPVTLATLPTTSIMLDDMRAWDYNNIARPRQEISGSAYHDRSQPSSATEILSQASNAADYNKGVTQQRVARAQYYEDYWRRSHEAPSPQGQQQMTAEADVGTVAPQSLQSPQGLNNMSALNNNQQNMMAHQQNQSHLMGTQGYAPQQTHQQNMMAQSPVRSVHQQLPSAQLHQGSPAMSMASMSGRQQTPSYGYGAGQMWPPPQPQQSPMAQQHHMPTPYGQQQHTSQLQQSPMHPPSQLPHGASSMGFAGMNSMGNAGYPAMNRSMYQPSPSPQQFGIGNQTTAAQQTGMQGWAPPSSLPQDWQQRYRQ